MFPKQIVWILLYLYAGYFAVNAIEELHKSGKWCNNIWSLCHKITKCIGSNFDIAQANISVWLSAAASCGRDNYKNHTFQGPTKGFVLTSIVDNLIHDTEGYVGYLPSDRSIYVVFRGSISTRNWLTDFNAFKTPYLTFPECNCEVHEGFYKTEQNVIDRIIREVNRLKTFLPSDYAVKVTGHSLGAALAQLAAMDLIHAGKCLCWNRLIRYLWYIFLFI